MGTCITCMRILTNTFSAALTPAALPSCPKRSAVHTQPSLHRRPSPCSRGDPGTGEQRASEIGRRACVLRGVTIRIRVSKVLSSTLTCAPEPPAAARSFTFLTPRCCAARHDVNDSLLLFTTTSFVLFYGIHKSIAHRSMAGKQRTTVVHAAHVTCQHAQLKTPLANHMKASKRSVRQRADDESDGPAYMSSARPGRCLA